MNNLFLAIIVFAVGLFLLVVYYRSIIVVGLLNRHEQDPFHDFISRFIWFFYRIMLPPGTDDDVISRALVWYFPLTVLFMIGFWYAVVILAFSFIFWSTGAQPTIVDSLLASGSSLSTLGFLTPSDLLGRTLGIIEGGIGLFAVFYLFTFVPDYISSVREREAQVSYIYSRTGDPPTGIKLLNWFFGSNQCAKLESLFEGWNSWFIELGETHDTAPVISLVPSPTIGKHWVPAVLCMLDTANLVSIFAKDPYHCQAALCLESGASSINRIAANLNVGGRGRSKMNVIPSFTKEQVKEVYEGLKKANVPVKDFPEDFWDTFINRRNEYSRAVSYLAEKTLVNL